MKMTHIRNKFVCEDFLILELKQASQRREIPAIFINPVQMRGWAFHMKRKSQVIDFLYFWLFIACPIFSLIRQLFFQGGYISENAKEYKRKRKRLQ